MSSFKDFFKQCEKLAEHLGHTFVGMDHVSACVLEKQSVVDFFNSIDLDIVRVRGAVDGWLRNTDMPVMNEVIIEEAKRLGRVPYSPMLNRIFFELNKASVVEQLQKTPEGIDSFFILAECLSLPETALANALELEGWNVDSVFRKLHDYMIVREAELNLNGIMSDTEDDYNQSSSMQDPEESKAGTRMNGKMRSKERATDQFCDDLTKMARDGKLHPIIGREIEMFDLTQILARKNKKNAALVGEAGVGKTQIVEGFAQLIASGKVPDALKNAKLLSLNLTALTAGTKFRGEMEERVNALIKELEQDPDIILFIDEMHSMMQAGGGGGGNMDFGTMFKPAMGRGTIKVIGATTYSEYRSVIEKDAAIARRFTKIDVAEPSYEQAEQILKGVVGTYEKFHKVKLEKDALKAIMEYSAKFLQNKRFPDKAIDLLDAASARRKVKVEVDNVVSRADIAYEVSRIANIPLEVILCEESDRMRNLGNNLKKRVFGQDQAVDSLVRNVMVARAGLREQNSVQGAFLFVGPSGTGKTEITKALADSMGVEMVRFDMSEFAQEHTVGKLIGSPPGYVGHDSGNGQLLDKVEEHPNCVLLLDEIEKAHTKVLLTFLQVLDEGRLTGSHGKTVFFNNVTVIMTTNLGARDSQVVSTAMGSTNGDGMDQAIKKFLPPEFINRIDSTVKFNELTTAAIESVVGKYMEQLNDSLKGKKVKVSLKKDARDWLVKNGVQPGFGARPMKRIINEQIRYPLAEELLFGSLIDGGSVSFTVKDNKLAIVKPKPKVVVE